MRRAATRWRPTHEVVKCPQYHAAISSQSVRLVVHGRWDGTVPDYYAQRQAGFDSRAKLATKVQ
jgi:hypothetical protein